ncbi:MAG: nucleotidyltransferase family protein [Flavobacteriales bacterium]
MANRSAIILAGGFGTRLQSVVADVPKPMAEIAGRPFLEYLLNYLIYFGVDEIVMSTGHLAHVVSEHFGSNYRTARIKYAVEESPLGTGGAIKYAMSQCSASQVLVINGDTFFDVNLNEVFDSHLGAEITMVLRPIENPDRFGTVELDSKNRVVAFHEKRAGLELGMINAGTYLMNISVFDSFDLPQRFSIETEFFAKHCADLKINGFVRDGYFIDIGIPEEYKRANEEFRSFRY